MGAWRYLVLNHDFLGYYGLYLSIKFGFAVHFVEQVEYYIGMYS